MNTNLALIQLLAPEPFKKAIRKLPPQVPEALTLVVLLSQTWKSVSAGPMKKIKAAFDFTGDGSVDKAVVKAALNELSRDKLKAAISPQAKRFSAILVRNAAKHFKRKKIGKFNPHHDEHGRFSSGGPELVIEIEDADFVRVLVDKYKEKIKRGEDVGPILVDEKDPTHIVDGNHRAQAYKELDRRPEIVEVPRIAAIVALAGNKSPREVANELGKTKTKIEKASADWAEVFEQLLIDRGADHIEEFFAAHPERFLNAEIEHLVELMEEAPGVRGLDLDTIMERLERLSLSDKNWEDIGKVESGRLWNTTGLTMAQESGTKNFQVLSQEDGKVCGACWFLHGRVFEVDSTVANALEALDQDDPDAAAEIMPFPRYEDLDARSADDISGEDTIMPPFHPHCRCQVVPLEEGDEEKSEIQKDAEFEEEKHPRDTHGRFSHTPGGAEDFISKELALGLHEHKGWVELTPPEPFGSSKEAMQWCNTNLADKVTFGKRSLDEINDILAPTRRLIENGVQFPRIAEINFGRRMSFDLQGLLEIEGRTTTLSLNSSSSGLNKSGTPEDWHQAAISRQRDEQAKTERLLADHEENLGKLRRGETEKDKYSNNEDFYNYVIPNCKESIEKSQSSLASLEASSDLRFNSSHASKGYDSLVGGSMVHELGHVWHSKHQEEVKAELGISMSESKPPGHLESTGYSKTNQGENFAENFALYMTGSVHSCPKPYVDFFDKQFPRLAFGKKIGKL